MLAVPSRWPGRWCRRPRKASGGPTGKGCWRALGGAVPADWLVLVLADRGLYARWLYQAITRHHWHPFLRINHQGQYRPQGGAHFRPLATVVRQGAGGWSGPVECFASSCCRLNCTLLAQWAEPHRDPWLIVTDLPPEAAHVAWYGLRSWIECGFGDLKRGGWDWQQTKMTDPARATRLWLVMAVATFAAVRAGGMAHSGLEAVDWDGVPELAPVRPRGSRPRLLSCFRLGLVRIVVALVQRRPLAARALAAGALAPCTATPTRYHRPAGGLMAALLRALLFFCYTSSHARTCTSGSGVSPDAERRGPRATRQAGTAHELLADGDHRTGIAPAARRTGQVRRHGFVTGVELQRHSVRVRQCAGRHPIIAAACAGVANSRPDARAATTAHSTRATLEDA